MKKYILAIALSLCALASALAQGRTLSPQERDKWLSEMSTYKKEFIARELELTDAQQKKFFEVYNQMETELNQIASETRDLEKKTCDDAEASDAEIETAARTMFEQKSREGAVESAYFYKFKEILTPKQLLRLKNAERKFTQQLVKRHKHARAADDQR